MYKRILKRLKYVKFNDFFDIFKLLLAIPCSLFFRLYNKIRNKKLWLVCENGYTARDNGYYFYKYIKETHPEEYCFFVIDKRSKEYSNVKKYNDVIQFKSFRHWIYYMASEFNVISHKDSNPNKAIFFVIHVLLNAINNCIFIQHGITKDYLDWAIYKNTRWKYYICGAKKEYEYITETYGYPEGKVVYTGFARFDNLHNIDFNKKQILIMPTWRTWLDEEENFEETDYYKNFSQLINNKSLIKYIEEEDITVLFYPHIRAQKYLENFKTTSNNIKILNLEYDIQDVLKSSSLLITDYSSVFFDFAYMKKPMIFFQFDKEKYREEHYKQGYFSYEKDGFGPITYNIEDTGNKIISYIEDGYQVEETYLERMNNCFELHDNKNCQRIYEILKKE